MRERGHVAPCEPTRDDRDDEESDEEEAARRAAFGREGPCPAPIVIEPSALREGAKRRGKGKAQSQNPSPGTPKGEP
jgi:hypothetical protein